MIISKSEFSGDFDNTDFDKILENSNIISTANHFLSLEGYVQGNSKEIVVYESEIAEIEIVRESETILVSGEATTCVIVFIICKETGIAIIAHVNKKREYSAWQIFKQMKNPVIYFVGGYYQHSGVYRESGREIVNQIISRVLTYCSGEVSIELFCVDKLNTNPNGFPIAYGFSFNMYSMEARPVFGPLKKQPAHFHRKAQFYFNHNLTQSLISIYDPVKQLLYFNGFNMDLSSSLENYFNIILSLSDAAILKNCSTSPLHELPNFVPGIRELYKWILERSREVVEQQDRKEYIWLASTGWTLK